MVFVLNGTKLTVRDALISIPRSRFRVRVSASLVFCLKSIISSEAKTLQRTLTKPKVRKRRQAGQRECEQQTKGTAPRAPRALQSPERVHPVPAVRGRQRRRREGQLAQGKPVGARPEPEGPDRVGGRHPLLPPAGTLLSAPQGTLLSGGGDNPRSVNLRQ